MIKRLLGVLAALLAMALTMGVLSARAQDVASLTGIVTDRDGGTVSDVAVKLADTRTGANYATKTGLDGIYRFQQLSPGPGYTLTLGKDGFQTTNISNLYLPVATTTTRNVQLEVGAVNETIEVKSEGSVSLNTTDSTIGNNFDLRAVATLPAEFRDDPAALLRLQPGVVSAQGFDPSGSRDGAVAGARADQNNITVDGIDAADFVAGASFATQAAIPVDAVQEFSTQVGDPTAAFGGRSGAQTVITTKSGSNQWHGSASEYNRTAATEANTFFNNKSKVARTNLVRNQFGANLGGPVKKDKLFFFFNYQGRRDAQQSAELRSVPFPHVGQGEIAYINATSIKTGQPCSPNSRLSSQDVNTDCVTILPAAQVAMLDPCFSGGCTNATTPGFVAPGVAPILKQLYQTRYPAPNDFTSGDGLNTAGFRFNAPNPLTENIYTARVDYNFNSKHKMFTRFNFNNVDSILVPIQFQGDPSTSPNIVRDRAWVIGETWIPNGRLVNQFTYGETRANANQPILFNPSGGLVELTFYGGALSTPFVRQSQSGQIVPDPTFRDDVTLLRGKHSIQVGVEWQPIKVRSTLTNNFNFIQEGLGGAVPNLTAAQRPPNILQDPNGVANLNWDNFFVGSLGYMNNLQSSVVYTKSGQVIPQGAEIHRRDYRFNQYAAYVQDNWKVRSDLTLTLGLRYQYTSVPYEVNGIQAQFVNTTLNQILAARVANGLAGISGPNATPKLTYQLSGKGAGGPDLYDPEKHDFSPRFAAAWNPAFRGGLLGKVFGDRKTVLRAQTALIYDQTVINAVTHLEDQSNYVYGNTVSAVFGGLTTGPRMSSASQLPFPLVVPPFKTPVTPTAIFNFGIDNKLKTPYAETISAGLQRELPGNFQLEVDYYGRYGRRLFVLGDAAQIMDFTDPTSKHTLSGDVIALEQDAHQNLTVAQVQPLPFFENQMTQAVQALGVPSCPAAFGSSCTQFVYANFKSSFQQGGPGIPIFVLQNNGLLPPNVGSPSQFAVNALGTNKGWSSYNGLLAILRKRLSRNLQFDVNYTFSHTLDNSSVIANNNGNFVGGSTNVLCDALNLNVCRGNAEFDVTHQISSDFIYDLPFGRGQFIGRNSSRWLDEIIGGWQVSGIVTWRTGLAIPAIGGNSTLSLAADNGALFTGAQSAVASGIHTDTANNNQIQFFADPKAALKAFSFVSGLTVGSRDTLRGPSFTNTDLAVVKNFPLFGEKYKLQFRAEAFNAFNHPNFGLPDTGITSSTFGVITSLAGQEPARVMQFALRFDF
jgi:hypothetical protein